MKTQWDNLRNQNNAHGSVWDKITFIGSMLGIVLLILVTFYRSNQLNKKIAEYKTLTKSS